MRLQDENPLLAILNEQHDKSVRDILIVSRRLIPSKGYLVEYTTGRMDMFKPDREWIAFVAFIEGDLVMQWKHEFH